MKVFQRVAESRKNIRFSTYARIWFKIMIFFDAVKAARQLAGARA
jgi:hypothetical protein